MLLEGSCSCGAVRFSLQSAEPYPYQRCCCSICRKAGGAGGYSINLGGDASTLAVTGREHVRIYRALVERDGERVRSEHERHFCAQCGSHLWAFHPSWPELVHPVAGAIDTPLPPPPVRTHMMTDSKAPWVEIEAGPADAVFGGYPDVSLAEWHRRRATP
jgi:hypothetical protein